MLQIKHILILLFITILSSDIYAQSGYWTKMNPDVSPPARGYHRMTTAGDGYVLLFGGAAPGTIYYDDLWIYSLEKNKWEKIETENSPPGRCDHGFCQLNDSLVILNGGDTELNRYVCDTWIFNLNTKVWTEINNEVYPPERRHHGLSKINDSTALLFGGEDNNINLVRDTWIFNSNTMTWKKIKLDPVWVHVPGGRSIDNMVELGNNKVLLHAGFMGTPVGDTWIFNLDSISWTYYPDSHGPEIYANSMTNFRDGMALSFGGNIRLADNSRRKDIDSVFLFDSDNNIWSGLDCGVVKPEGRHSCSIVRVSENKFLMYGGLGSFGISDETWLLELDLTSVRDNKRTDSKIIQKDNLLEFHSFDCSIIDISLIDLNGISMTIFSGYNNSNIKKINLNEYNLSSGIYIACFKTGKEEIYKKIWVE